MIQVEVLCVVAGYQRLCWYPDTTLHGVTSQKTSTWNITAFAASKLITWN